VRQRTAVHHLAGPLADEPHARHASVVARDFASETKPAIAVEKRDFADARGLVAGGVHQYQCRNVVCGAVRLGGDFGVEGDGRVSGAGHRREFIVTCGIEDSEGSSGASFDGSSASPERSEASRGESEGSMGGSLFDTGMARRPLGRISVDGDATEATAARLFGARARHLHRDAESANERC
jgi:hypothetical protein